MFKDKSLDRRHFIRSLVATGAIATAGGLSMFSTSANASNLSNKKFVFLLLRGGMDGLGMMPAVGDANFTALSGRDTDYGAYDKLDSHFALHPAMQFLNTQYQTGQASFIPAMAAPYRTRSHFDAQDFLEYGSKDKGEQRTGWMARLANEFKGSHEVAVALSKSMPINLIGTKRALFWAPSGMRDTTEDTMDRLMDMYAGNPAMSMSLEKAINSETIAKQMGDMKSMDGGKKKGNYGGKAFNGLTAAAGKFLSTKGGPNMAMLELGGWDTHSNQHKRLANQLKILDRGLKVLKESLKDEWANTVVFVTSEFGRTANMNGTGGSDHGTGGTGIMLGGGLKNGSLKGGTVMGDWPGLKEAQLYKGRDLMHANSTYGMLANTLHHHMGFSKKLLKNQIFGL